MKLIDNSSHPLQDISFVLEDYMELNFNTILEDGSTDELGDLLVFC